MVQSEGTLYDFWLNAAPVSLGNRTRGNCLALQQTLGPTSKQIANMSSEEWAMCLDDSLKSPTEI